MAITSRVSQDRRSTLRVIARVDCCFTFEEKSYEAVIVDLSIKGAFLSAKFLPPSGSTIYIELQPPMVKKPISLGSTVLRGTWVMSDQGKRSRFGVRFGSPNLDLIPLIKKPFWPGASLT